MESAVIRVLAACECSGVVRDAFLALGHDAWSNDLIECERPGPHLQMHAFDAINKYGPWDLMIAFPPCTHVAVSGARYFKGREAEQAMALMFMTRLLTAHIRKVALENPVGVFSTHFRKPDQIIQPYQFGHDASKATCLWLKNLPKLRPTEFIEPRIVNGKKRWANQTDSWQNRLTPSPTRAADRARTYEGIARAMAEQWGSL